MNKTLFKLTLVLIILIAFVLAIDSSATIAESRIRLLDTIRQTNSKLVAQTVLQDKLSVHVVHNFDLLEFEKELDSYVKAGWQIKGYSNLNKDGGFSAIVVKVF